MPTLSFIVPLRDGLPLTQAMLRSLRATIPADLEHEIVFVDDASTDGTPAWLKELRDPVRSLRLERTGGYARASNRGASSARGSLLVLLNNDLEFPRGWLEPMLEAHRRLGERAGAVGNVQRNFRTGEIDHAGLFIDHKGKPEHLRRLPARLFRALAPVRRVAAATGACLLIERALWERLGGFDEAYLNGCEDVDLCFRAAALGRINAVALRSVVRHHVSATPGRKDRDEANARRLALRWAETLAQWGEPDWSRNHFETYLPEPRDFPDRALALAVAFY
ncbi:MAG: glycosyltransferase family 2 protein, partial [Opitutaceae bacterium]